MMKDVKFKAALLIKIERYIGIVRFHKDLTEVGHHMLDGQFSVFHIEIAFTQEIIDPHLGKVALAVEVLHMLEVELISSGIDLQYIHTVHI